MIFSKKNYLFLFATVVAIVGIYYYNPFALYFQNDDFIHIPLSAEGRLFQHNSFRPVCDLSIMLDYFLWHKTAWGYHLTNLIIHCVDTMFVFIVCRKVFTKYTSINNLQEASLLTALLFFIYPMHSEAVFWILGRSASLGVLFFLLSVFFYLNRNKEKYFLLSLLFAIISWLTYESTWILPVVFLIISLADNKLCLASFSKDLKYLFIIVFCFVAYLIARFYTIHEMVGEYEAGGFLHLNVPVLAGNYLKLMMRSWLPSFYNPVILVALFVVVVAVLLLSFFKIKSQRAFLAVFILLWLFSLSLYASLGVDTKGTESERFLYLPSIFVCMLTIYLVDKISNIFLRRALILVLFSAQLFFLFINASSYRFAGNIVKTTLDEINKVPLNKNVYINNLPQQDHGALIFRTGFFEAVNWMRDTSSTDSLFLISQQYGEQQFCRHYKVINIDTLPQITFTSFLYEITGNSNEYIKINTLPKQFEKGDVYFNFTDSSLNVQR